MPATNPSPEVLSFFKSKSIKPSYNWKDVFEEEHAYAFTVAKATEMDVLSCIKDEIEKSIVEGLDFKEFQKNITPKLQSLGWWGKKKMVDPKTGEEKLVKLGTPRRLQTIFDVNIRTANAAGKWERIQRTKHLLPYLQYLLGPSAHHRLQHLAYEDMILSADDDFWATHYPPNGWGCKCFIRQISKSEANDIGVTDSPKVTYKEVVNSRTGKVERKYDGVDFGFANNPGLNRMENLASLTANKLPLIDAKHANLYYKQLMSNSTYKAGLTQDYKSWLHNLKKLKQIGEQKVVGVLSENINVYFNNNLQNNAIAIDDKIALKNEADLTDLITDILQNKAILFNPKEPDYITVILHKINPKGLLGLLGSLLIKLNLNPKTPNNPNYITKVSFVNSSDLTSTHEVISGNIN